jgi:hypothetical protein
VYYAYFNTAAKRAQEQEEPLLCAVDLPAFTFLKPWRRTSRVDREGEELVGKGLQPFSRRLGSRALPAQATCRALGWGAMYGPQNHVAGLWIGEPCPAGTVNLPSRGLHGGLKHLAGLLRSYALPAGPPYLCGLKSYALRARSPYLCGLGSHAQPARPS